MAHYAYLNSENIVENVIVGIDEEDLENLPESHSSWEDYYGAISGKTCKRTSYNTRNGKYTTTDDDDQISIAPDDQQVLAFRGNFAMIGGTYDPDLDVFLPPKPFDSWIYDEELISWKAPIDKPEDFELVPYLWDEVNQTWKEVTADNDPLGDHFG